MPDCGWRGRGSNPTATWNQEADASSRNERGRQTTQRIMLKIDMELLCISIQLYAKGICHRSYEDGVIDVTAIRLLWNSTNVTSHDVMTSTDDISLQEAPHMPPRRCVGVEG